MEEIITADNVNEVADVQTEVEQTSSDTNEVQGSAEVETSDITQTQAFSKRLNEAKQKAIDEEYSRLYGEYGIHTKAEYEKVIAEQQAEEERERLKEQIGIDPDELKPVFEKWKESDPDFAELKAIRAEKNATKALTDLNNELKDAGVDLQLTDLSNEELQKVPNIDKVTEYVKSGHSLADAFFLANKKDIITRQSAKTEQETIKKITANGESSPGSLSTGGETVFFTREQVQNMSRAEVNNNWKVIMESQKHWKS